MKVHSILTISRALQEMFLYRVIWVTADQPMSGMLPQLFLHLYYLSCFSLCPISQSFLLNPSASPGLSLSGGTESLFNGLTRQLNQPLRNADSTTEKLRGLPAQQRMQVNDLHISDLPGCSAAPCRAEKGYIYYTPRVNHLSGIPNPFHLFCFPVIFTTLSFRIKMQKIILW